MKKDMLNFEIRFYEKLIRGKRNFVDALIPLAEAYTQKGLYKKGLEIDRRLSRLLKEDDVVHYNLACSFALTGDEQKALASLKKAVRLGYDDFRHMRRDPDLKILRKHPDFLKILEKAKPARSKKAPKN
jgi:tetratricopeptide (TPR) repeat protein